MLGQWLLGEVICGYSIAMFESLWRKVLKMLDSHTAFVTIAIEHLGGRGHTLMCIPLQTMDGIRGRTLRAASYLLSRQKRRIECYMLGE